MANSIFRHLYADAIDGVLSSRNYIKNAFAAQNANGWNLYSNTAQNTPVSGTGGSVTGLALAASSSTPLEGDLSFLLTQSNSTNIQGKGVSYDFTVNNSDLAKLLAIRFDYQASSTFVASDGVTVPLNDGTTSTNAGNSDIEVFIYDITNSVLIPVNPSVLVSQGSGYSFNGTFQTNGIATSYRLILHIATANANATGWTFKFDNVSVGRPSATPVSFPGTDVSLKLNFTPVQFGTPQFSTWRTRRVGDSMEVKGSFEASSVQANPAQLTLPTGLFIDKSKFLTPNPFGLTVHRVGIYTVSVTTGSHNIFPDTEAGLMFFDGSDTSNLYFALDSTGGNLNKDNASTIALGDNNAVFHFEFTIPILGWGANNNITTETDLRSVVFAGTDLAGPGTGGNLIVTPSVDTHNAYNISTGVYTIPVSGCYYVSTKAWITTNSAPAINIFLNGSSITEDFFHNVSNNSLAGANSYIAVQCTAGDTITVQVSPGFTLDGGLSNISIFKITGGGTIINSNTVAARASGSMSATTAHTPFIFPSVDFDTNNAYNTSTGQYRVPVSGYYEISGAFFSGSAFGIEVWKNGSFDSVGGYAPPDSGSGSYSTLMKCTAGDLITVVPGLTTGTISNSNLSIIKKI